MRHGRVGAIALGVVITIGVGGCAGFPFAGNAPDPVPSWDPTAKKPVMLQEWQDGFVPAEDWNVDTVRIYGDGRWEAERQYASGLDKPPVMVASGSLSSDALHDLLGTVFTRNASGKRFLDLPERVDAGITDVPITRLAVDIQNASHSVSVSGPNPDAFDRVQKAMAARTIAVPFPDGGFP